MSGQIHAIIGPMFASKTTELIANIDIASVAGIKCLVIKSAKDIRYTQDACIRTHGGFTISSSEFVEIVIADKLADVVIPSGTKIIAVDEGQFFVDLAFICNEWANIGYKVIVSALNGTFQQVPFDQVSKLIAVSDFVTKKQAICMKCKDKPAIFTIRTVGNKELELIGGEDLYKVVCRSCFLA